ncbi:MAG: CvpA family protein [Oscillospiraceae bacterium]|nr:CvpA family protein [Oscillospiraceae bacterium]
MEWVIGILVDLIIVGIIVLCVRKGSKDGFAKTLVGFFAFAIAIVLAGVLCAPAANLVYDKGLREPIENTVYGTVAENFVGGELVGTADQISQFITEGIDKLPSLIKDLTGIEEKKDAVLATVNELKSADIKEITDEIVAKYVAPVIIRILSIFVFIILFVVLLLVCKLLSKGLKLVNKLPLIGKLNAFLGGVLGLLQGAIVALVISWVLVAVTSDGGSLFGIISAETIESSLILKTVSTYNPLNTILSKLTF